MAEYLNEKIFEQDVKGFLFFMETTQEGIERAKIVFEFNKEALYKLREGDIVAVESFSSLTHEGGKYYSLLEITRMSPTHITIDRLKRYRFMGAVREFLKEATKDFEEGDPRLIRDHVYIESEAVVTGYMMKVGSAEPEFINEPSKPILGRDVGVLKPVIVEKLINQGVEEGLVVGKLYSTYEEKREVDVKVKPHKMVTHHYSIFGFTGAGKSNLSSLLVTKLIEEERLNTIIFDLSDEYTALLIDVLEREGIIVIDKEDVPDSLVEYLEGTPEHNVRDLAKELSEKTKKPGVFDSDVFVETYQKGFEKLIKDGRIKLINTALLGVPQVLDFRYFMSELEERCSPNASNAARCKQLSFFLKKFVEEDDTIRKDKVSNFLLTEDIVEKLNVIIFKKCYEKLKWKSEGDYAPAITGIIASLLEEVKAALESQQTSMSENYVTDEWLLDSFVLKREADKKLCIIVSSEKTAMAKLIHTLIDKALRIRRKKGTKTHDVLFLVDEAHEFVINPREAGVTDDERQSSRIIERLTRMGRKYGLGTCISSQRVAYLNTTAISNCHTSFIGALPRRYDRDAIYTAYGVAEEVLNQVVTFPPGNWYIVSSGAMGINNVPVRIFSSNREVELAKYFKGKNYLSKEGIKVLTDGKYLD